MHTQIDQLIRKAKLKFFTNQLFFFGMMANKFAWEIEPLPPQIEGFVKFNLEDQSKIESGAIHINETYLTKPDYTYNNLVFILCHELLHILNKHVIQFLCIVCTLFVAVIILIRLMAWL